MWFEDCRFDDVVSQSSSDGLLWRLIFRRCTFRAGARLAPGGECVVDSCDIEGGLRASWADAHLTVTRSTIRGGGAGIGIDAYSLSQLTVSETTIRGFAGGILVEAELSAVIIDNTIEDCAYTGINVVNSGDVQIARNIIRRCGTGIESFGYTLALTDNLVDTCSDIGLLVILDGASTVARNVVSHCGDAGIWIAGSPLETGRVHNNTMCFNAGSGLVSEVVIYYSGTLFEMARNVGFGNGRYGLDWRFPPVGAVTCNDWFGNQLGPVGGGALSPEDFVEDPLFCDAAGGDFHPSQGSPLVNRPACGLVGALDVGCAATPTLVERFVAERTDEGVRLNWRIASLPAADVWLERSEHSPGPWDRIATERTIEGDGVSELDRTAVPERAYWYRLVARDGDGRELTLGVPIAVSPREALGFRIVRISPIPAEGPVQIEFALPRPADVTLDLFDVQGRTVATLTQGVRPAGRHTIEWSGRISGVSAPAGFYVVRYRFPGGQDERRLVRAR